MRIVQVSVGDPAVEAGLARLTAECVADGDSIGFLADVGLAELADWWRALLADPAVRSWCALAGEGTPDVVGTVSLRADSPATGRHRAEVTKLLVGRAYRRNGVARALLDVLEADALDRGLTLLVLDTEAGSPAEHAYRRLGWTEYGRLDRHAARPDGTLSASAFFAKRLG